ncbi:MAG: GAF domain-containing protein [Anaerolineae bacterium]
MATESVTAQTLRFLQTENARLQEENDRLRQEVLSLRGYIAALDALQRAAQNISSETDLEQLLDTILYSALEVVNAADGSLLLLDLDTDELVFVVVHGQIESELCGYRIGGDEGLAGWVAAHGEPLIVNEPRRDPRFLSRIDELFGFETKSIICVPLVVGDRALGVVEILNKFSQEPFNEADLDLLTVLANIAATALDKIASAS